MGTHVHKTNKLMWWNNSVLTQGPAEDGVLQDCEDHMSMELAQSLLPTFSLASQCAGFCLWAVQQAVPNGTHIHHPSSCSVLLGTTDSFINMKKRQSNECVSVPRLTFSTERQTRVLTSFQNSQWRQVLWGGRSAGQPRRPGVLICKPLWDGPTKQLPGSPQSRKTWRLFFLPIFFKIWLKACFVMILFLRYLCIFMWVYLSTLYCQNLPKLACLSGFFFVHVRRVYTQICVCACLCLCRGQRRKLRVLLYPSLPHSCVTGSLTDPRARLEASKFQTPPAEIRGIFSHT